MKIRNILLATSLLAVACSMGANASGQRFDGGILDKLSNDTKGLLFRNEIVTYKFHTGFRYHPDIDQEGRYAYLVKQTEQIPETDRRLVGDAGKTQGLQADLTIEVTQRRSEMRDRNDEMRSQQAEERRSAIAAIKEKIECAEPCPDMQVAEEVSKWGRTQFDEGWKTAMELALQLLPEKVTETLWTRADVTQDYVRSGIELALLQIKHKKFPLQVGQSTQEETLEKLRVKDVTVTIEGRTTFGDPFEKAHENWTKNGYKVLEVRLDDGDELRFNGEPFYAVTIDSEHAIKYITQTTAMLGDTTAVEPLETLKGFADSPFQYR